MIFRLNCYIDTNNTFKMSVSELMHGEAPKVSTSKTRKLLYNLNSVAVMKKKTINKKCLNYLIFNSEVDFL